MGADGQIYILSSDVTPEEMAILEQCYYNIYRRNIFGHDVITVYMETERDVCDLHKLLEADKVIYKYLIAEWEVWT